MDKYQDDFIRNLKFYRKKKGYSQARLAELCEVSTGTIGNIECGKAKPSFDLLIGMADKLGIHPAFLLASDLCFEHADVRKKEHYLMMSIYKKLDDFLNREI